MDLETDPVAHLWVDRIFRNQLYPELAKQSLHWPAVAPPEYRVVCRSDYEDPSSGDDALCRTGELTHLFICDSTDKQPLDFDTLTRKSGMSTERCLLLALESKDTYYLVSLIAWRNEWYLRPELHLDGAPSHSPRTRKTQDHLFRHCNELATRLDDCDMAGVAHSPRPDQSVNHNSRRNKILIPPSRLRR